MSNNMDENMARLCVSIWMESFLDQYTCACVQSSWWCDRRRTLPFWPSQKPMPADWLFALPNVNCRTMCVRMRSTHQIDVYIRRRPHSSVMTPVKRTCDFHLSLCMCTNAPEYLRIHETPAILQLNETLNELVNETGIESEWVSEWLANSLNHIL